jgi:hypothetical protein
MAIVLDFMPQNRDQRLKMNLDIFLLLIFFLWIAHWA